MTQRYKITVEYDGTDLLGWQKQLDGPSAQEFLEKAVEAFCQEKTEVYGAGRTTFTPAIRPSDALIFTASPTAGRRLSLTKTAAGRS